MHVLVIEKRMTNEEVMKVTMSSFLIVKYL